VGLAKRRGLWVTVLVLLTAVVLTVLALDLVLRNRYHVVNDRVEAALNRFASKVALTVDPDGTPRVAGPSDPVRAVFVLTTSELGLGEGRMRTWILTTTPQDPKTGLDQWELMVNVTQSRQALIWTTEVDLVDVKAEAWRLVFLQPLLERELIDQGLTYRISEIIH